MDMIQFELNAAMKIPACGYSQCTAQAAWFALLIGQRNGTIAPTLCWACQAHKPALVTVLLELTKASP